jgi:hypothetical protein
MPNIKPTTARHKANLVKPCREHGVKREERKLLGEAVDEEGVKKESNYHA